MRVFLARSQIIPIASMSKTVPRTLSAVYFCWNVARLAKFKVHSFIFWHTSTGSESADTSDIGHRTSFYLRIPVRFLIQNPDLHHTDHTTIPYIHIPHPHPGRVAIRPYRFIATIEPHHDKYRYRGPAGFHI